MTGDHLTLVKYYDRLFDQELTSQYSLSTRIDPGGLSFSVYSYPLSRYLGLESVILNETSGNLPGNGFGDHLGGFLRNHSWLPNNFKQSCVIVTSLHYTIVPHALYLPDKKSDYLDFVFRHDGNKVIHEHFLNSAEAWIIFAIDRSIDEVIGDQLKHARIMHHAGALIETILPQYRHNELQNPVFVNIREGSFDIIVLKDGRLRYCNSFSWKVNDDLVYFLIFVLDQLVLNPENVSVMISGNIDPATSLFELIQRYIRHVDFLEIPDILKKGISFPLTNSYKFCDLLNPGLCE